MKKNFTIRTEPLDALPVFRVVARLGSFSRAADHLGISPSAVSQNVRALEARLGVRLLNRTSRQVALSEAGQRFLEQIDPALEQLDAAMQGLRAAHDQPSGLLRINLSRAAAAMFVAPRLTDFLARYPLLQLELFTDDALSDLVKGSFDAGIRMGRHLARDMIALPLDRGQPRVVVAAPDYLRRHGTPRTLEDLAQHDCIRFRLPGSGRLDAWNFRRNGRQIELDIAGRLIFADDHLTRRAAREGLGLSQQFEANVREDLAAGRLVQVLQPYLATLDGFYIYYPAREHLPPKLRAFVDFLREPLLGGSAPAKARRLRNARARQR